MTEADAGRRHDGDGGQPGVRGRARRLRARTSPGHVTAEADG